MSEVSLQDVLVFNTGPWLSAADGWRRLAAGIDDTEDQLTRGTRDLPEAWRSGAGAQAAAERATTHSARVRDMHAPVKSIGDQLELHGYAMAALRTQAEQIIAEAKQAGYTVNISTLEITAPASAYMGGNLDQTGRALAALASDLVSVLERARAQDAQTAGIVTANAPAGQSSAAAGQAAAIDRAEELALKIKNPSYRPTPAELAELNTLLKTYGKDKVFAHDLLTTLGPKGLLELTGTLATYQYDRVGKDPAGALFDGTTAGLVKDLQNDLGVLLGTATERSGTTSGLRGEDYTPGQYELSGQWVADLMAAGRSKMDVGDPYDVGPYVEDVYGYQLLSPLLRNGELDPAFVATVGGDIVDFEMQQGKGSDLWGHATNNDVRLDWTDGYDDNIKPAGYDPVRALVDGLSRNGEGARDLFTGLTESSTDPRAPDGGRLPRLDYLLTDRDWTPDLPHGSGWDGEAHRLGDDYKNAVFADLGSALERATVDHPGEAARHLTEAIVYETAVDEQNIGAEGKKLTRDEFMNVDVIQPGMRDSMANIMSAYIVDVNANIAATPYATEHNASFDRDQLTRLLADLGKDESAHATLTRAEAAYGAAAPQHILSGQQHPGADIRANLDAMQVVSGNYGSVMGALDLGANEATIQDGKEQDEKHNSSIETRYKVIGPMVEGGVGWATRTAPGASDLFNGYLETGMEKLEEREKQDSTGAVRYQVGEVLSNGRAAAVDLVEGSMYESGNLKELPPIFRDQSGDLRPMHTWGKEEFEQWDRYKATWGQDTVGRAADDARTAYNGGYDEAQKTIIPDLHTGGDK
jgi:hypothetical protein